MVCCCLVRQGEKYGQNYTRALKKQLNLAGYYTYILGDGADANIPLKYDLKGWWAKMELFSPELKPYRPFMYLDLDSLIIEPFIVEAPKRFTICQEWNSPGTDRVQSSLMLLPKDTDHIWYNFLESNINFDDPEGDQGFLRQFEHDLVQDLYPGLISSYKAHSKQGPTSKIVTFHGEPKQSNPKSGWAYDLWREYTT